MSEIRKNYTAIANAIRHKTGSAESMTPNEMPTEIENITTGIEPEGTRQIRANGEYNIREYESVNVDVPGATIYDTYNVTTNGTYDIAEYANVDVAVPNPSTGTLEITQNGNYDVSLKANVDVQVQGTQPSGTTYIEKNGHFDVSNFADASVNVNPIIMDINHIHPENGSTCTYETTDWSGNHKVYGYVRNIYPTVRTHSPFGRPHSTLDAQGYQWSGHFSEWFPFKKDTSSLDYQGWIDGHGWYFSRCDYLIGHLKYTPNQYHKSESFHLDIPKALYVIGSGDESVITSTKAKIYREDLTTGELIDLSGDLDYSDTYCEYEYSRDKPSHNQGDGIDVLHISLNLGNWGTVPDSEWYGIFTEADPDNPIIDYWSDDEDEYGSNFYPYIFMDLEVSPLQKVEIELYGTITAYNAPNEKRVKDWWDNNRPTIVFSNGYSIDLGYCEDEGVHLSFVWTGGGGSSSSNDSGEYDQGYSD